ncbi:hypothetical protein HMPREF1989_01717 [Porphyromonas gingivalis F0566]|nr:hypothetical protein HMPREF1989_01717 [Porphyromonas gingivalis F0566]
MNASAPGHPNKRKHPYTVILWHKERGYGEGEFPFVTASRHAEGVI